MMIGVVDDCVWPFFFSHAGHHRVSLEVTVVVTLLKCQSEDMIQQTGILFVQTGGNDLV